MKTSLIAFLPLAGLAEYTSITVTPLEVKDTATPMPTTCSRRTVTKTEVEKVTVTVEPNGEPVKTIDVTSTSTLRIKTTVTVRPSRSPVASISSLVWTNYPNSTFHAPTPAKPTSALPDFTLVNSVKPAGEKPTEPASVPTPEAKPSPETSNNPKDSTQAADSSAAGSKRGEATFYGGNVGGGMCSFTGYTIPSNLFGTALSDSNWASAQACGQCVKVTGPSGTQVTAMVVDQCPGCGNNHLDLFPDAFAKLADPSKGIINVSWDFVPCGITSPIVLKNKSGTSKFWFSMQVMNANVGVSKLEVSTDGGSTWKATTRQPYNFFENSSGFGTDSVDVKVTSIDGKSIVVKGVSIAAGTTKTASSNF